MAVCGWAMAGEWRDQRTLVGVGSLLPPCGPGD